jgi:hypothetical protein
MRTRRKMMMMGAMMSFCDAEETHNGDEETEGISGGLLHYLPRSADELLETRRMKLGSP